MVILQISDTHLSSQERLPYGVDVWASLRWALMTAQEQKADCLLISGDIALHEGESDTYAEMAEMLRPLPMDVLLMPGNHDDRLLFETAFGRRYVVRKEHPWLDMTVTIDGVFMVFLDSADCVIDQKQLEWLDIVLWERAQAVKKGCCGALVLLCIHHPVLTGFSAYMDRYYMLKNASEVLQHLQIYQKDLRIEILCGHYHYGCSMEEAGIYQHCSPSTYVQIDAGTKEFRVLSSLPQLQLIEVNGHEITKIVRTAQEV